MVFEIREGKVCKRYWEVESCSPSAASVASMYDAGLKMYVDGKALKRSEAIEFCKKVKK